jgi:hypothetical protein
MMRIEGVLIWSLSLQLTLQNGQFGEADRAGEATEMGIVTGLAVGQMEVVDKSALKWILRV